MLKTHFDIMELIGNCKKEDNKKMSKKKYQSLTSDICYSFVIIRFHLKMK